MADQTHQSYLLRLWRDHAGAPWRATLVDVHHSKEHRTFATLDALFAFLVAQTTELTESMRHHTTADNDHTTT